MEGKTSKKEGFKMRVENATRNFNNWLRKNNKFVMRERDPHESHVASF